MLLTVQQTAEYLDVPYYIAMNMVKKGIIPCVRQVTPRKVWVREEDVKEYKNARDTLHSLRRQAQEALAA